MPKAGKQNQVRIIGGKWRGRLLDFADAPGLRPSGDRMRETLFNWLQADIVDGRCLDLFAGSGVLGFESASRGAKSVLMIDNNPSVCQQLDTQIAKFEAAEQLVCRQADSLKLLVAEPPSSGLGQFDLVFVDPPFAEGMHGDVLDALADGHLLADNALVYLETARQRELQVSESTWKVHREKSAGSVSCWLLYL